MRSARSSTRMVPDAPLRQQAQRDRVAAGGHVALPQPEQLAAELALERLAQVGWRRPAGPATGSGPRRTS